MWRAYGATGDEAAELLTYTHSPLHSGEPPRHAFPLPDEPFVAAWERYVAKADEAGVWDALGQPLVQLRFPIEPGISLTPGYRMATRRGVLPHGGPGLRLAHPEGIRLFLHPTAGGRVPVIVAHAREDFVALVQALTERNEPAHVPRSMGACMIAGYNNWDRFNDALRRWPALHPERIRIRSPTSRRTRSSIRIASSCSHAVPTATPERRRWVSRQRTGTPCRCGSGSNTNARTT